MDYFPPAGETNGMNHDAELQAKFDADIREREEKEAAVTEERVASAKTALEQFETERQTKLREAMAKNREAEQVLMEQLATDIESDNPWDRIVSLVDLQTGMSDETLDVSRMRQVLIQLKNSPPGAVNGES